MQIFRILAGTALATLSLSAQSAYVTYIGYDTGVTAVSDMVNSHAAAAQFDAAVSIYETIDFESPIPSGVTLSGGALHTEPAVSLSAYNITPGGNNSYEFIDWANYTGPFLSGGMTFADPIDSIGLYITGLQDISHSVATPLSLDYLYTDGSVETIALPLTAVDGSATFIGFTDFGSQISSVHLNAQRDIVGTDDIRFSSEAIRHTEIPAPGVVSLLCIGLMGLQWRRPRGQG